MAHSAKKLHLGNMADLTGSAEHLIGLGLSGGALDSRLRERVARKVSINCFHEQLPELRNRIQPSATQTDALGIPRPEITYRIGAYVRDSAAETHKTYDRIAEHLGGTEIEHDFSFGGNNHIMGTTIMGDDASNSVVDADCRTHAFPNLYVAGSSVFPSSAAVNSTLTLAALALRLADTIAAEPSEG